MNKKAQRRSLSRRKVIIFSLLVLVLFFALAEIAVRLAVAPVSRLELTIEPPGQIVDRDVSIFRSDPLLFWKLKPDLYNEWWDYTIVSTNSSGFRYPRDFTKKKGRDTIRIVCLGDSITFGYRVVSQNTYSQVLERTLQKAFPEKKFEVIPLAVPGYTSFQGYMQFKAVGARLRPDCVIISFGWNDITKEDCSDIEAFQRCAPIRGIQCLLRNSQTYLHLCKWTAHWRKKNIPQRHGKVHRVSKEKYVNNFRRITELAKRHAAAVVWLAPMIQNTDINTTPISSYRKELEKAAQEDSVPFLKIPLLTEEKSSENETFFGESIHPSDRGHYLLARELFPLLLDSKALPLQEARVASLLKQYKRYYSPPQEITSIAEDEEMLQPGLLGRLYTGITPHGEILHASAEAPIDFTWYEDIQKPLAPPFCIVWEGFLKITEDEEYEFATRADDGALLWIDKLLVVDNSGHHEPILKTGKAYLKRGLHPIELRYYDSGFGATIRLLWAKPGEPLEIIPAHVQFH